MCLQDDAKRPAGMKLGYGELALWKQMGWGNISLWALIVVIKGRILASPGVPGFVSYTYIVHAPSLLHSWST